MTCKKIPVAALMLALPLTTVANDDIVGDVGGWTQLPDSATSNHNVFGKVPEPGESIGLGCKIAGFNGPGRPIVNIMYTNTGTVQIAGGVIIQWTRGDVGGRFRLESPLAAGESRYQYIDGGGSGGCTAAAKHPYRLDLSKLRNRGAGR